MERVFLITTLLLVVWKMLGSDMNWLIVIAPVAIPLGVALSAYGFSKCTKNKHLEEEAMQHLQAWRNFQ